MASGSFTGKTSNTYIVPKITWSSVVNTTGNYSDVTATLTYSRTNTYADGTSGNWSGSITINGVTHTGSKRITITYNSNTQAISNTVRVYHNDNGSKSITIKATGSISGASLTSTTISQTVVLDTIARGSTIEEISDVTLGYPCTIEWTPASSSYYYKIKLVVSDWSWDSDAIYPNITSSYVYTTPELPLDIANQLPNSTSGAMTAYLYTYSDSSCSNKVGSTSSKTCNITIPSSVVPSITSMSIGIINSNSIVDGWGVCVKGYSQAEISCVAHGEYGSTVKTYALSGEYFGSVASMPYVGSVIKSSGEITFSCIAKDSRGRSSEQKTQNIIVYDYYLPSVIGFVAERNSDDSTKITVQVNYDFASVNNCNDAVATLYYKNAKDSIWIVYGDIGNGVPITLDGVFDEEKSYNFRVVVKDSLSETAQSETFISTRQVTLDLPAGGEGLGIGKICQGKGLEVGFDANFYKDIYLHKTDGSVNELFSVVDSHISEDIAESESNMKTHISNEISAIKNAMINLFGKHYNLEYSVVAGDKWTINDHGVVLIGNTMRLGLNATRSEAVSGNIANEVVLSYTINHGGKIKGAWNITSVNREAGCIASFSTTNIVISDETLTIDVMLTATASSLTDTSSLLSVPVTLNLDAYF